MYISLEFRRVSCDELFLGSIIPHCVHTDERAKKGVNCISEEDVIDAVYLLNAIKPELHKRSVANKCFDPKLKAHMTESEVINFCLTNFGIKVSVEHYSFNSLQT